MENQPKKKRGAPPGNRNAVKHGYYAKGLNRAQQQEYSHAADVSGLDEEITLLRVAVKKAAAADNPKALFRAVTILDKCIRTRYRVSNSGRDERLKQSIAGVIKDVFIPLGVDIGTSVFTKSVIQTKTNGKQSLSNANQTGSNGHQMPNKPKQIDTKQITNNEPELP
jgi:hypothetical protein